MTRGKYITLFLIMFVLAVAAQTPLSAALGFINPAGLGVSYSRAEGTVWNGKLIGVSWRGSYLGEAGVAVRPLSFLLARAVISIELLRNGAVSGSAILERRMGGGFAIKDARFIADIADLPTLLPLDGTLSAYVPEAVFDKGGCVRMDATLRTDVLANAAKDMGWAGPSLSGDAVCSDGAVMIPLEGRSGAEHVSMRITLLRDRTFSLRVSVRTDNQEVAGMLDAAGFSQSNDDYVLTQAGRWG